MNIPKISNNYQNLIKKVLKKNKISIHDFCSYGLAKYDWETDHTILLMRKHRGIYDFLIGKEKGNMLMQHPYEAESSHD